MSRPRDRQSAEGLLPRMEARPWKCGTKFTYRYHPVGGKPMNLGTDKDAALRKVLDLNGQSPHHGSLTWTWEQYQKTKRWLRLAEGTRADYEVAWKQIDAHLGKLPAASISSTMVARYVHVTREGTPRRADIEKTLMSNVFKHGILLGVCSINPTIGVQPHGSEPSTVMPQEAPMRAFLAWLTKQAGQRQVLAWMIRFAALCGSRRVEFLDVTWMQIDFDAGKVRLPRAKQRGRVVFDVIDMSPALRALLKEIPQDGDWVFTTRDGNAYTDRGWKTLWQRAMTEAIADKVITKAQRFNFHALRRYYVTNHRAQEGDLPDLHADKRVTSRVYDATKEVGRKAL